MRRLRLLIAVAACLAADQLVLKTVLADGELLGRWIAPYDPPLFTEIQRQRCEMVRKIVEGDQRLLALSAFDPELGWCPSPGQCYDLYEHDWSSARIGAAPLSRERSPDVRRVVAVGGSLTQGAEVPGPETWTALIDARHPELEIANLAVGGYGLDQMLLRYRRDGRPLDADEVWLGLYPGAWERVTTLFPPVASHWTTVASFKPRFVLDGNELRLVPSPAHTYEESLRLVDDQAAFFEALRDTDYWVMRTPDAFRPRGSSLWHRSALARLVLTLRESGDRAAGPWLDDPEHPLVRLLDALLDALCEDVRVDGARLRVIVVPAREDLWSAADGETYWNHSMEYLRVRDVEVLDLAPVLLAANAQERDELWMPFGHYSREGSRLVAAAVEEALLGAPPVAENPLER